MAEASSERDIMVNIIAFTHAVVVATARPHKCGDKCLSDTCRALEVAGCTITKITIPPICEQECAMLARAVSKNKSLQTLLVVGNEVHNIKAAYETIVRLSHAVGAADEKRKLDMAILLNFATWG